MLKQFLFIICILSISGLYSCKAVNRDIIILLGSKQSFKRVATNIYSKNNGFCSSSLFLNGDSTFLYETGCEGRSHITIGTWGFVSDSIELIAIENSKLTLVANVEMSRKNNGTRAVFLFLDKRGIPVHNFIIRPISNKEKHRLTSDLEVLLDSNGRRVYCPKTNEEGFVTIEKSDFDTLVFPQLERIGRKTFRFPTQNLADSIKICLDIVDYGIEYPELTYDHWNKPFRLEVSEHKIGDLIKRK